jgi:hypothetical protein
MDEILLWAYQELDNDSKTARPRHVLGSLPVQVENLIGAFGNRLVLYTADHWIASVELQAPGLSGGAADAVVGGSFVRHFFLPNDWIGSMIEGNMISAVGRGGEILLARRYDLGVIKRGLEVTEDGGTLHSRRANHSIWPQSGGRLAYRHRASSSTS